jgi:hypothetical protein
MSYQDLQKAKELLKTAEDNLNALSASPEKARLRIELARAWMQLHQAH